MGIIHQEENLYRISIDSQPFILFKIGNPHDLVHDCFSSFCSLLAGLLLQSYKKVWELHTFLSVISLLFCGQNNNRMFFILSTKQNYLINILKSRINIYTISVYLLLPPRNGYGGNRICRNIKSQNICAIYFFEKGTLNSLHYKLYILNNNFNRWTSTLLWNFSVYTLINSLFKSSYKNHHPIVVFPFLTKCHRMDINITSIKTTISILFKFRDLIDSLIVSSFKIKFRQNNLNFLLCFFFLPVNYKVYFYTFQFVLFLFQHFNLSSEFC